MSIFVGKDTRLLVQGITGREGSYHTARCIDYGTQVVAGVTPGKGGQLFADKVPVYDTVKQGVDDAKANGASLIFCEEKNCSNSICISSDSIYKTIQGIAREWRSLIEIPLLGITGSNGKTTTKELITYILKNKINLICGVYTKLFLFLINKIEIKINV